MTRNFIGQYILDDLTVCDKLIEFYKNSNNKIEGSTSKGINKLIKDSTDVSIYNYNEIDFYLKYLANQINQYINEYQFCAANSSFQIVEGINIQHYEPNQGYYLWHCERVSSALPVCNRHLFFITYLNDVEDQGETEFYYQELKIKPKKGLTIIAPADWTHTHRGITSPTQEKYIITGWFNYN